MRIRIHSPGSVITSGRKDWFEDLFSFRNMKEELNFMIVSECDGSERKTKSVNESPDDGSGRDGNSEDSAIVSLGDDVSAAAEQQMTAALESELGQKEVERPLRCYLLFYASHTCSGGT